MTKGPLVTFEDHGVITVAVIKATRVLDALNVTEFGQELLGYVNEHSNTHLLINFEHVHYLSSAVLTELLRVKEAVESGNGSLKLCALNKDIRRVFEITNLDKIFVIYDEADGAVHRYERSLQLEAEDEAWLKDGE